jgi:hypothetical protein
MAHELEFEGEIEIPLATYRVKDDSERATTCKLPG